MGEATGVSRTKHPSGMEFAYFDKDVGKPIGIPREQIEAKGYLPAYDNLPEN